MVKYRDQNLVENKYVHKKKIENVLLANLRRALPTHIPKCIWNKEIESAGALLTKEEAKMLRNYYILHNTADFPYLNNEHPDKKMEGEYYLLLNVPHFLEASLLDNKKAFSSKEIEEIKTYYTFNEKRKCYMLHKAVRDVEEVQLLTMLQRKDICMSENEKYQLSGILEKLPGFLKENIFYANMIIDLNHEFFFEHPTEHLPGMMVMEAARQFIIAVCHIFGRIPVVDFSMILGELKAEFKNYIELHHPVKLKGVITKLELGKDQMWKKMTMDIFILQKDVIAGLITIGGQGISKTLFSKLRRTLPKEHNKSRYYPISTFYNRVTIRRDETNENLHCALINVSLSGFCIEMNHPILEKEGIPVYDFIFCFEKMAFIFGKCRIVWQIGEESKYFAGIEIIKLSLKDQDNLYEAIKRYCYVVEEREIL